MDSCSSHMIIPQCFKCPNIWTHTNIFEVTIQKVIYLYRQQEYSPTPVPGAQSTAAWEAVQEGKLFYSPGSLAICVWVQENSWRQSTMEIMHQSW